MSSMAPVYRGEELGEQIYTMHSIHPYTDINKWGVTKSIWRQKSKQQYL